MWIKDELIILTIHLQVSESVQPPGQPQMVEVGDDVVKLEWAPSVQNARYIVEYREVGDPEWHTANYDPIVQNGIQGLFEKF